MKDDRTMRQMIIDRIIAYNDSLEFYAPDKKQVYDFDAMPDGTLIRTFEALVFNHHKVKDEYRKNNPEIEVQHR